MNIHERKGRGTNTGLTVIFDSSCDWQLIDMICSLPHTEEHISLPIAAKLLSDSLDIVKQAESIVNDLHAVLHIKDSHFLWYLDGTILYFQTLFSLLCSLCFQACQCKGLNKTGHMTIILTIFAYCLLECKGLKPLVWFTLGNIALSQHL
jgi:hypothetical protein